ncbi:MAG TPA: peptidoglycan-binding protein, partial [Sphingomicrobium sp.]|nr:peptidoglycan-binding protein [Sphingomicrobium sp.]
MSVPLASCGNPFASDPNMVDAEAVGVKADPQVRAFYAARKGQVAWNGSARKQLVEILDGAPAHGLKRELFLKGELPDDESEREIALTKAALRYASALAQGYSDPKEFGRTYTVPRPEADVAAGIAKALQDGDLGDWYASLAPRTAEYRLLSREFVRFLKLANDMGNGTAIPLGEAIEPGERDTRLPAIARALAASGYLVSQQGAPPRYTPALVDAVKAMQADFGLEADGIIGADAIKALNEGPGDRARQLAVNLERLRWLERNPPATRIDVNTGGAFLEYWRDGTLRDRRRVIVGQPDWETPQLGSPIFQLVAHPYWRVPDSIYEDELASKGPAYFAE